MEIRILRNFEAIAREGNMTRAAERLHISQPSLSKQIKDLEAELGKPLFNRHSASMTLTEEGLLLLERTEAILAMVDKTVDEFKTLDDISSGDIYIGCAESNQIISGKIRQSALSPDERKHRTGHRTPHSRSARFRADL